jgi:hypothetical protein
MEADQGAAETELETVNLSRTSVGPATRPTAKELRRETSRFPSAQQFARTRDSYLSFRAFGPRNSMKTRVGNHTPQRLRPRFRRCDLFL